MHLNNCSENTDYIFTQKPETWKITALYHLDSAVWPKHLFSRATFDFTSSENRSHRFKKR